jgi:uncharacterized protein DUF2154
VIARLLGVFLFPATAAFVGCGPEVWHGPPQHDTQSIELDKTEMTRVEIKMGAGELQASGGSPKLLDADFTYPPRLKPVVRYNASSFRGQLSIEEPHRIALGSNHGDNKWRLKFNNDRPLDVVVDLGAGEARMDLGALNLRSLGVNMGAGELQVDLRGNPKRDFDVRIHGGAGEATVRLPKNVAIDARAAGGIGEIEARGLEKREGRWINPDAVDAPATIHLDIEGGVGSIRLIAE